MENKTVKSATRDYVYDYALNKFGTTPEHPWMSLPLYAVLRRSDNKKWYAIVMNVQKDKLGIQGEERVDVLNVKCDSVLRDILLCKKGFLPAYHLDRKNWITVLLDGTVDGDTVCDLLDGSYELAKGKPAKKIRHTPTSWIVPVNPKYYDIEKAFAKSDTILWKQSNSIIAGDTVYLYLTAPYSCIRYKCVAVEAGIPYNYDDGKVRMSMVMKIERLYTYERDMFGLDVMKEHGVVTLRGPRSIPYRLRCKLEKECERDEK